MRGGSSMLLSSKESSSDSEESSHFLFFARVKSTRTCHGVLCKYRLIWLNIIIMVEIVTLFPSKARVSSSVIQSKRDYATHVSRIISLCLLYSPQKEYII